MTAAAPPSCLALREEDGGRGAGPGLIGPLSAAPRGRQEREDRGLGPDSARRERDGIFFTLFSILCF
jgi:hypothetical protein